MMKTPDNPQPTSPFDPGPVEVRGAADNFEKVAKYRLPGADEFCVRAVLRPGPKLLDVVLPGMTLDDRLNVPARRAFTVGAFVASLCLCLFGRAGNTSVAPASDAAPDIFFRVRPEP